MSRFIVHDHAGLNFQDGSSQNFGKNTSKFENVEGKVKCFITSKNGKRVAWLIDGEVRVVEGPEWKRIGTLHHPKAQHICFSPQGNYLAVWESYIQPKGESAPSNMSIYSVTDKKLLSSFPQRIQTDWEPQWTDDESIMARMSTSEVHFYKGNNLEATESKKTLAKLKSYSLSPSAGSHHVTFFIPSLKGAPAYVQLFKYPSFKEPSQALANKSFFKVDTVMNFWNPQCTAVLLLTTAEVDKSGMSYYGAQMLFYLNTKGDSNRVTFTKQGDIRSVCWMKTGKEFLAIYGYAPAKATLFNHKCDPVKEFGESVRNFVLLNPVGNLILLGAMGNISPRFEIWDPETMKKITGQEVPDSTQMEWSPCGQYILTSTCSPRLRVNNGYKVWHYSGTLQHEKLYPDGNELYKSTWLSDPKLSQKSFSISAKQVKGIKSQSTQASKERYVPPSQRIAAETHGISVSTTKRFLSQREDPASIEEIEKTEKLKKKKDAAKLKKAEAKKKKKDESKGMDKDWREEKSQEEEEQEQEQISVSKKSKKKKNRDAKQNGQTTDNAVAPEQETSAGNEMDKVAKGKRKKAINKKLEAIKKLKEDLASGKNLDSDQLVKMKTESSLLKEFEQLSIGT